MENANNPIEPRIGPSDPEDGGEMAARIRSFDWGQTPLGPFSAWPSSLKTAVRILSSSRYPMFIWWGDELINIYNDAYIPVLGARHPQALGAPARQVWADIWNVVGPQAAKVIERGESTWNESLLLLMARHGFTEETYFTFSYSAAPDDDGRVRGVFCACTDDTRRVLGERRLKTLSDLGGRCVAEAETPQAVCHAAAEVLADNPHDFPFALVYLLEGNRAELAATSQIEPGTVASPLRLELGSRDDVWGFEDSRGQGPVLMEDLERRFGLLPAGPWHDDATRKALVVPILRAGPQEMPAGFLVAGLSPRRVASEDYRSTVELAARQIGTALANVRAYQEERERAEKLAELDRAKTAFFSNVSHEFRTPLTLMLAPLEDVARAPDLPPEVMDNIELAQRNGRRLLRLVNTLLDFSRIEAGRIDAVYEPTDLAVFTADLASLFRSAVQRAGLRFVVECEPLAESVYVDREMWEKIVFNLLSNALKFTFEGTIAIALRAVGEGVELSVRDTGIGVPPEELPHLFERFHRVRGAPGRSLEGSGIGLALVQELVRLHGGDTSVRSEVGGGSTFAVFVPFGTDHLPRDRISAKRQPASTSSLGEIYVEEALRWISDDDTLLSPLSPGIPDARRSTEATDRRPTLLLADDNADMRGYLNRLLSASYHVVAVADGEEAWSALQERPVDLVLADVMMPNLDGFGLLERLRADERTKATPLILLSARAGEESEVEGLTAGADDYLVKPFSGRELMARIEAHLKLSMLRREAGEALRASEERFRTMADHAPVMIWVTDAEGACTYLSKSWYEFTGQRPPEGLGYGWVDALHPDDRAATREAIAMATRDRRPFRLEYRLRRADGVHRWAMDSAAPRFEPDHTFGGFIGSVVDITERKDMEDALKEADRRKDEFLALLAHELRNPLSPIVNAVQVLKLLGDGDAQQRWAREVIERQTQHLTRLVDDLLDVSRITRGKVTLSREPLDLSVVVTRAVETSRPLIDARRHELEVRLPSEPLRVEGDMTRLVQVVGNLLNNAAKYTDEGGHLELEARREGDEAVLSLRDDGVGLSPELLPHVFGLFTQAERSLDRSQGGLGVGLTIVRRLVEMHGGEVTAESAGSGQGSLFVVRLPALVEGAALADARPMDPPFDGPSRGLRILVVEDNPDAADTLRTMLELAGHQVRTASDGAAAIEEATRDTPHVVLCDIGLPGMSGYEVAAELRQRPALRATSLIALTGYGHGEARQRAVEAGFDHHLVKPVEPQALSALLGTLGGDSSA